MHFTCFQTPSIFGELELKSQTALCSPLVVLKCWQVIAHESLLYSVAQNWECLNGKVLVMLRNLWIHRYEDISLMAGRLGILFSKRTPQIYLNAQIVFCTHSVWTICHRVKTIIKEIIKIHKWACQHLSDFLWVLWSWTVGDLCLFSSKDSLVCKHSLTALRNILGVWGQLTQNTLGYNSHGYVPCKTTQSH